MTQLDLLDRGSPFDTIRRTDESGEWWSARDLMAPLGYERWQKFEDAIVRAIAAAANTGADVEREFSQVSKVTGAGNLGEQVRKDYRLSRFAAYLVAMNGDPRKPEIAAAQNYFAHKTREAEQAARPIAAVSSPAEVLALAEAYVASARELVALNDRLAIVTPMAAQAEQHRAADGLIQVGDFANKVKAWAKRQHGAKVLHVEVWDFLGQIGLLIRGNTIRNNQPTAFAVERDFVRVKETEYATNTTGLHTSASPRLTPAGEGWAWDRAVRRIAEHGSLRPSTNLERKAS